jgi:acyl-coenzyme A thioesterase PaaI-like protein
MLKHPFWAKFLLNIYPPLFFQRISLKKLSKDFKYAEVRVHKSLLNRNMNGTIFGGTIFSAADPFYSLMLWQIFHMKGYSVQTWLKSAEIHYKKPAATSLTLKFVIKDEEIDLFEREMNANGKFSHPFTVEMIDKQGEVCAIAHTEAYIRKISTKAQKELSGF